MTTWGLRGSGDRGRGSVVGRLGAWRSGRCGGCADGGAACLLGGAATEAFAPGGGARMIEPARPSFSVGVSSAGRGGGGLGQGALGSVTLGDGCFGGNVQVATVTVPFRQQCVAFG